MINILGFLGHGITITSTHLCCCLQTQTVDSEQVWLCYNNPLFTKVGPICSFRPIKSKSQDGSGTLETRHKQGQKVQVNCLSKQPDPMSSTTVAPKPVLQLTLLAASGWRSVLRMKQNKFYTWRSQLGVWHKSTLGYCLTSHLTQSEGVRGNPSKVQDFRQCCHPLCVERSSPEVGVYAESSVEKDRPGKGFVTGQVLIGERM